MAAYVRVNKFSLTRVHVKAPGSACNAHNKKKTLELPMLLAEASVMERGGAVFGSSCRFNAEISGAASLMDSDWCSVPGLPMQEGDL